MHINSAQCFARLPVWFLLIFVIDLDISRQASPDMFCTKGLSVKKVSSIGDWDN